MAVARTKADYNLFIGGEWKQGSGGSFSDFNPATGGSASNEQSAAPIRMD